MFRMFKDAKMTGEMLVYFCIVEDAKTCEFERREKKMLSLKLENKQEPN